MDTRSKTLTGTIADRPGIRSQEADALILNELLKEELKRQEMDVLRVRRAKGGFAVRIRSDPQSNERWYSDGEIRTFPRVAPAAKAAEAGVPDNPDAYVLRDRSTVIWESGTLSLFAAIWTLITVSAFMASVGKADLGIPLWSGAFVVIGLVLAFSAWRLLYSPYEVEIVDARSARFVSVLSDTHVALSDISRIVRRVDEEDRSLLGFDLTYPGGSASIAPDEQLLTRFKFLCTNADVLVHSVSRSNAD